MRANQIDLSIVKKFKVTLKNAPEYEEVLEIKAHGLIIGDDFAEFFLPDNKRKLINFDNILFIDVDSE